MCNAITTITIMKTLYSIFLAIANNINNTTQQLIEQSYKLSDKIIIFLGSSILNKKLK